MADQLLFGVVTEHSRIDSFFADSRNFFCSSDNWNAPFPDGFSRYAKTTAALDFLDSVRRIA
jgi:hypothetical protein